MNGQWKGVVGNDLRGRANWVKPPKGLDNFLAQQILSNSALLIRLDVKVLERLWVSTQWTRGVGTSNDGHT